MADAAHGGPLELVRAFGTDWVAPWETLLAPDRFSAYFALHAKGGRLAARSADAHASLADGDTIDFPPGVTRFDPGFLKRMDLVPRDLTFDGAGMDESLVLFPGWNALSLPGDVHGLTFRDLTLHLGDAPWR